MQRFHVFHPDHEIAGATLINFQNAIGGDDLVPYYEKHGLAEATPLAWYPLQNLLDVYNDLAERGGAMFDYISVGLRAISDIALPADFNKLSLVELFHLSDTIYRMTNRGSNIGSIACETISDNHVAVTYTTPYPDHLWYGIAYGFARRFLPSGTPIVAYFDDKVLRREEGGLGTRIHVKWGS